ncbi:hypothetical protein IAT38_003481 [Cryptococcus sp. DSM 104549]
MSSQKKPNQSSTASSGAPSSVLGSADTSSLSQRRTTTAESVDNNSGSVQWQGHWGTGFGAEADKRDELADMFSATDLSGGGKK